MGRPGQLTRRWILVVKWKEDQKTIQRSFSRLTVLNGQDPVAESPFCARCLMMGANDSAVDHLQGIRDFFPQPRKRPAPELAIDRRPLAKLVGQVTPRRPRARNPENPIQNKAMVRGFASVRGARSQDEALMKRPFLVRHQVSCQAGLHRRYQLESRSPRHVNLFCQHGLAFVYKQYFRCRPKAFWGDAWIRDDDRTGILRTIRIQHSRQANIPQSPMNTDTEPTSAAPPQEIASPTRPAGFPLMNTEPDPHARLRP